MNESEILKKYEHVVTNRYLMFVRDIFKYGLASVCAMVVDVGLLYILVDYIHMNYLYATTIAFCFGLAFHYALVKIFVFKISRIKPIKEFVWYALIGLIGLILNNLIIYILVRMQLWYIYAKLVSLIVVFFFNFSGRRRLFKN